MKVLAGDIFGPVSNKSNTSVEFFVSQFTFSNLQGEFSWRDGKYKDRVCVTTCLMSKT